MKPEERQMLMELYTWMQQRKQQQITGPLDDASKNSLGALLDYGAGSTALTQSIDTSGSSATVPAAFTASRIINLGNGSTIEVPIIA